MWKPTVLSEIDKQKRELLNNCSDLRRVKEIIHNYPELLNQVKDNRKTDANVLILFSLATKHFWDDCFNEIGFIQFPGCG
jgi:hypothetical protein